APQGVRQPVEPPVKRAQLRMLFELLQAGNDVLAAIPSAKLQQSNCESKRQKRRGPRGVVVRQPVQDLAYTVHFDSLSDGDELLNQQLLLLALRRIFH